MNLRKRNYLSEAVGGYPSFSDASTEWIWGLGEAIGSALRLSNSRGVKTISGRQGFMAETTGYTAVDSNGKDIAVGIDVGFEGRSGGVKVRIQVGQKTTTESMSSTMNASKMAAKLKPFLSKEVR